MQILLRRQVFSLYLRRNRGFLYMKKSFYIILTVITISVLLSVNAFADVGNIFDDDDGGGINWGGDGNFDLGGLLYIGYFLSDNPVVFLLAVVAFFVVMSIRRKHTPRSTGGNMAGMPQAARQIMSEPEVVAAVTAVDPYFSAEQFKAYAADVFLRVQEAWEKRDWRVVRPFESDKLFSIHERQLQEFIDRKKTNHLDGQNIKSVTLAAFKTDGTNEVLTVRLHASLLDYTTDDATGKLLAGSKTERRDRVYRLVFIRSIGVKTDNSIGLASGECPSCGAPIEVSHTGVCEYCRNVITNGQYGWVLNEYAKW